MKTNQNNKPQIPKSDYLKIKVIPKSAKTELVEIIENGNGEQTIKIRIKAIPEKGKANEELIKFLSKELNIQKSNIKIIAGKSERIKLIRISKEKI